MMKKLSSRLLLTLLGLGVTALFAFPVYLMLTTSFKSTQEYFVSPLGLPPRITFENYAQAWTGSNFPRILLNSLLITAVSVLLVVIFASLASYPLARYKNKLSGLLYIFFVAGLMLPFQSGLIALVCQVKDMGLLNTYTGAILVYAGTQIPFPVFLFTGYIKSLPKELDESAEMDGCNQFQLFWKIIFPMMKPVIATSVIITSLNIWNDFLVNYLLISSGDKRTLPAMSFIFFGKYNTNWGYGFAMLVLSMLPLIILFLFLQKYIIKGMTAGAIKG